MFHPTSMPYINDENHKRFIYYIIHLMEHDVMYVFELQAPVNISQIDDHLDM